MLGGRPRNPYQRPRPCRGSTQPGKLWCGTPRGNTACFIPTFATTVQLSDASRIANLYKSQTFTNSSFVISKAFYIGGAVHNCDEWFCLPLEPGLR